MGKTDLFGHEVEYQESHQQQAEKQVPVYDSRNDKHPTFRHGIKITAMSLAVGGLMLAGAVFIFTSIPTWIWFASFGAFFWMRKKTRRFRNHHKGYGRFFIHGEWIPQKRSW